MKLKELLATIPSCTIIGSKELILTGISANSKLIKPGYLFIAKKGKSYDGKQYIAEAVEKGACAVLTDSYHPSFKSITQILHSSPETIESLIVAEYYQNPSHELLTVGITGTNGKTTTSLIIKSLLDSLQGLTGLIGTIEYVIGSKHIQAERTTPDVVTNHHLLRDMIEEGCHSAVMEVTSHALMQGRVEKIDYDVAVFTNLTWDHLDYHGNMENYCLAKSRLFENLGKISGKKQNLKWAVINQDCPWHKKIIENCSALILTYGIEEKANLRATDIRLSDQGTWTKIRYRQETLDCYWPLVGRFNVYNCLAAIAVLITQGIPLSEIVQKMAHLPSVRARLERLENDSGLKIYIDYAHTEDALKNVLMTLNEVKRGKLITLFGCGGDRDKLKRPHMAKVCENYSDFCIVTTDNPRSEDPVAICNEIGNGFSDKSIFTVELDRYKAIEKAIKMALPEDLILIAGKGHEAYQIFADRTVEFDDYQVALKICSELALAKGKSCVL